MTCPEEEYNDILTVKSIILIFGKMVGIDCVQINAEWFFSVKQKRK